jgi:hypothetical protein
MVAQSGFVARRFGRLGSGACRRDRNLPCPRPTPWPKANISSAPMRYMNADESVAALRLRRQHRRPLVADPKEGAQWPTRGSTNCTSGVSRIAL